MVLYVKQFDLVRYTDDVDKENKISKHSGLHNLDIDTLLTAGTNPL